MEGPIWAVPEPGGTAVIDEAIRLAERFETETDDRPRVVAVAFAGIVDDETLADHGPDAVVTLQPGDGEFARGASSLRARTAALADLADDADRDRPDTVLFRASSDGDVLAARFARRTRGGVVTDCLLRVRDGDLLAGRGAYAERAYVELAFEQGIAVASVNLDSIVEPQERIDEPNRSTHTVSDVATDSQVRQVAVHEIPEQDLARAQQVVAGGRGLGDPAGFEAIEGLADAVGATVGASRPPADDGWVPYDRQIGVTGKEIDVELYVPCAISGDPYHMRSVNADHLLPINTDPDARIFGVADLGVVGDVYEYGPAIAEAIRTAKDDRDEATEVEQ